jgi:hypothetical protein
MTRFFLIGILTAWLISCGTSARAAEYFVSTRGNDTSKGLSPSEAFATITKGVSVLTPGDTLTILPGTYYEAVNAKVSGSPEAPITIRSAQPHVAGAVLIRGDRDVSGFTPVPDFRYTHVLSMAQRVEGVVERDTRYIYAPVLSIREVENTLGSFYQDDAAGLLYVHTSDSRPPAHHAIAASISNGFGLFLEAPRGSNGVRDIIVDGLSFTGFFSRDFPTGPGRNRWGLFAQNPERVTVRRCTSFLNSGGIFLVNAKKCVVEDNYAFANFSRSLDFGNNILGWGASDTLFRRNTVEGFGQGTSSSSSDITIYSGSNRSVMEDNLAINAGVMIKGGLDDMPKEDLPAQNRNRAVGAIAYFYWEPNATNLLLKDSLNAAARLQYADPFNHDFRPQGTAASESRVFFVSPTGNDAAAGTSLSTAWRTLAAAAKRAQPGQTVYITAGVYREALVPANSGTADEPIRFMRYAHDAVILDGQDRLPVGIELSGQSHVQVHGLLVHHFAQATIRADRASHLRLEQLTLLGSGRGITATDAQNVQVRHCLMRGQRDAGMFWERSSQIALLGNLLDQNTAVALRIDETTATTLISNWNNFVSGTQVLAQLGSKKVATLADWRTLASSDSDSLSVVPGYRSAENGDFTLAPDSPLAGRGPLGATIGPYRRSTFAAPAPIEQFKAVSVTATTANLEWWTPRGPTVCRLSGALPVLQKPLESPAQLTHSLSLIGLPSGKKITLQLTADNSVDYLWTTAALPPSTVPTPSKVLLDVQTLPRDPAPRTLHVAVTGDDRQDGLSKETAWRTVAHAASRAVAGDTVLIHEGTYEETVQVRSTGDQKAPLTFRAAPGSVVWFSSSNRQRSVAFSLESKHHVRIDGLRFDSFNYVPHADAVINIIGGSNHTITRCLADGRVLNGYSGSFIRAELSDALLVENCVVLGTMAEAFVMSRVPRATIRHCVIYNTNLRSLTNFSWNLQHRLELSHNLFCDSIPSKINNALMRVFHLENLVSDHNGYFTRTGPGERRLVESLNIGNKQNSELLTLEPLRAAGQERNSVFGNPGFRAVKQLVPGKGSVQEWRKTEVRFDAGSFAPFDFEDFFCDPTGPMGKAADGKPIGLDRRAFANGR